MPLLSKLAVLATVSCLYGRNAAVPVPFPDPRPTPMMSGNGSRGSGPSPTYESDAGNFLTPERVARKQLKHQRSLQRQEQLILQQQNPYAARDAYAIDYQDEFLNHVINGEHYDEDAVNFNHLYAPAQEEWNHDHAMANQNHEHEQHVEVSTGSHNPESRRKGRKHGHRQRQADHHQQEQFTESQYSATPPQWRPRGGAYENQANGDDDDNDEEISSQPHGDQNEGFADHSHWTHHDSSHQHHNTVRSAQHQGNRTPTHNDFGYVHLPLGEENNPAFNEVNLPIGPGYGGFGELDAQGFRQDGSGYPHYGTYGAGTSAAHQHDFQNHVQHGQHFGSNPSFDLTGFGDHMGVADQNHSNVLPTLYVSSAVMNSPRQHGSGVGQVSNDEHLSLGYPARDVSEKCYMPMGKTQRLWVTNIVMYKTGLPVRYLKQLLQDNLTAGQAQALLSQDEDSAKWAIGQLFTPEVMASSPYLHTWASNLSSEIVQVVLNKVGRFLNLKGPRVIDYLF
jgi:hypothetical protein